MRFAMCNKTGMAVLVFTSSIFSAKRFTLAFRISSISLNVSSILGVAVSHTLIRPHTLANDLALLTDGALSDGIQQSIK